MSKYEQYSLNTGILSSIIANKNSLDSKPAYDASFQDIPHPLLHYSRQWFGLCPFGEVIDRYNNVPSLSLGKSEMPNYVNSLLGKGPKTNYRSFLF